MSRIIPTPGLAIKIAVVLDLLGTLLIEQVGFTFGIPAYNPAILIFALGLTYFLFRWRDEVAVKMIELTHPFSDGLYRKAAANAAETASTPVRILGHGIVSLARDLEDAHERMRARKIRRHSLEGKFRK